MARVQVYVVRIYDAAPDGSQLRGIVEDVEGGSRDRFTSASELWEILRELYAVHDTLRARDDKH